MPWIISNVYTYKGEVNVQALNVETSVVDVSFSGKILIVEGYIDLSEMQYLDYVTIRERISVDGVNLKVYEENEYSHSQRYPIFRFHTKTVDSIYNVTITQTKGTPRKFKYSFFVEVLEPV